MRPRCVQYSARDGVQTYKDSNRALFKPRNVQAYAEFREHPRQPTWRETFTPVIRVHAILCNEARTALYGCEHVRIVCDLSLAEMPPSKPRVDRCPCMCHTPFAASRHTQAGNVGARAVVTCESKLKQGCLRCRSRRTRRTSRRSTRTCASRRGASACRTSTARTLHQQTRSPSVTSSPSRERSRTVYVAQRCRRGGTMPVSRGRSAVSGL